MDIKKLEKLVEWGRMKFKAKKSRSVVIQKGKVEDKYQFKIQGELIPSLKDQPVKSLGKWYFKSLNDRENIRMFVEQVKDGLKKIEETGLPGKYKVWMLHHGLVPKIRWPMMLYEISMTTIEATGRKVSSMIKKWLGIPRSMSAVGLYSTSSKLQLPFVSLEEEFKVAKTGTALSIRESKDKKVAEAGVVQSTGRKWSATEAIKAAEARLRQEEIGGIICHGK